MQIVPVLSNKDKSPLLFVDRSPLAISDFESATHGHVWHPVRGGNVRVRASTKFVPEETTVVWANATYTALTFAPVVFTAEEGAISHVDCNVYSTLLATEYLGPVTESENTAIATKPLVRTEVQDQEEEVVEFRCLPPRVQSIAALRNKVKLTQAAADFVKGVRAHAFRIEEDAEEQSE